MSTVKADNFTWKSGQSGGLTGTNVTGDQIVYGVTKAWANLNGATPALRSSFNMSSVTKNATGDWTLNFNNSFIDANYAVGTIGCASNAYISGFKDNSTAPTSSAARMSTLSGSFTDANSNYTTWNFNR